MAAGTRIMTLQAILGQSIWANKDCQQVKK